jgi:hypothetical protein
VNVIYNLLQSFSINQFKFSATSFVISLSILFLLLLFVGNYNNIIKTVEGQANMDSFTARGIIFTQLTETPVVKDQNINESESIKTLLNQSLNSDESNTKIAPPILKGQWAFEVNKGEVSFFRVLFTLSQNDKLVNAFALYNLSDTRYIQLNDKGTEIISGTVDLTSLGQSNETLKDIDATITISGLTQLRIALDPNIVGQFFSDSIMGVTRFLADGSGNIIIQPAPAPRSPSPSPSAPMSQGNSLYGSNFLF